MEQTKIENDETNLRDKQQNTTPDPIQEELSNEATGGGSLVFIQVVICSMMIIGILFIKYIQPNTIFKEKIKQELTQTMTVEEVKQLICELEEMSDKYWRIK